MQSPSVLEELFFVRPKYPKISASDTKNPRVGFYIMVVWLLIQATPILFAKYGAQYYKIDEVWVFVENCLQNSNLIVFNNAARVPFTTTGGLTLFRQCVNVDALPADYFGISRRLEKLFSV